MLCKLISKDSISFKMHYILQVVLIFAAHESVPALSDHQGTDSELIVDGPRNTAVVTGTTSGLQCSTNGDSKFRWLKALPGSNEFEVVYTGLRTAKDFESIYSFDVQRNTSSVGITSVNTSHAGTYICNVPEQEIKRSAELIVLESDPWCAYDLLFNNNHDQVRMWCTVSFRGNWAPVMEWRGPNMSDPVDMKFVKNRTIPNQNVTYTLTVPFHLIQLPYTCTTKFIASMRPTSTDAQNIPDYTFTWTSPGTDLFENPEVTTATLSRNFVQTTSENDQSGTDASISDEGCLIDTIVEAILVLLIVVLISYIGYSKWKSMQKYSTLPTNKGSLEMRVFCENYSNSKIAST